jgi:hypothetical protein
MATLRGDCCSLRPVGETAAAPCCALDPRPICCDAARVPRNCTGGSLPDVTCTFPFKISDTPDTLRGSAAATCCRYSGEYVLLAALVVIFLAFALCLASCWGAGCARSACKPKLTLADQVGPVHGKGAGFPLWSHQRGETRQDKARATWATGIAGMLAEPDIPDEDEFADRPEWRKRFFGSRPGVWSAWGRRSIIVPKHLATT